jgi:predicted transcriptional regulator of viral defense system
VGLPEDRAFVERLSKNPRLLLSRMAKKGLLHRVAHGRYIVAGPGAEDARFEVPAFVLLDSALAPQRYALSFLSALAHYGLTDHDPYELTILLGLRRGASPPTEVAGLPVRARVERRDDHWFGIRTEADGFGRYQIADPERAIIDSLDRPELSGGPETVVRALAGGLRDDRLRVVRLIRYGAAHSIRVARRLGFLLETIGVADERLSVLQERSQRSRRSDSLFGTDAEEVEWSARWRVQLDVPPELIEAWAAYEES